MDNTDKLMLISKKNIDTLENLKKFIELVNNIEDTLITNINKTIEDNEKLQDKLNENLELFYKISKNLLD